MGQTYFHPHETRGRDKEMRQALIYSFIFMYQWELSSLSLSHAFSPSFLLTISLSIADSNRLIYHGETGSSL